MLLPLLGSDYQRRRFPRLTVTIILICTVIYFLSFYLVRINRVIAVPDQIKLESMEEDLMLRYIQDTYPPEEAARKIRRISFSPRAAREFQREFEQALADGKAVGLDSQEYRDYLAARQQFERALRHDVTYIFGYVPADPSLLSLVTYQFMHSATDILHLFWNMVFLWLVGANLEDVWGRKYFLIVYLVGGAVAAVTNHAIDFHSHTPLVGASGSIATLMGAYAFRFARVKLRFGFFKWLFWFPAWPVLLFWFGEQAYYGLKYWGQPTGVATWAHVGGFGFGFVASVLLVRARAEDTFIAETLIEQDRKDREKAARKAAIKAGPRRAEEFGRAIKARQIGHLDEARELLLEAIVAAPADAEAREELVRLLFTMERPQEAAVQMGDLVEHYLQARDPEHALHWYGEICRLGLYAPAAGPWQLRVAPELERRGQFEAAAENYRSFGSSSPTDPRAPKALFQAAALLRDKAGKADEAMTVLDLIGRRYPTWMPLEVQQAREQARRKRGRPGP
jgi:membrane associated rhomboid family serine protease